MKINEITTHEWSLMSDEERARYISKENVAAREKYKDHQRIHATKSQFNRDRRKK